MRGCDPRVVPGDGHGVLDEAVTYAAPLQAAEDRALCPSAAPLGRLNARHPATRTNLIPNAGSDAGRARFSGQLSCSTRCRERPAVRHATMRRCASFRSAVSCRRASDSVRAMAMPRRIELQPPPLSLDTLVGSVHAVSGTKGRVIVQPTRPCPLQLSLAP